MAVCSVKDILSKIRHEEFAHLYYIYGTDLVQVKNVTEQLVRKATNDQVEMALTKWNGNQLELSSLEEAIQMFPMFAPYNCILINDLNAEALKEETLKKLLAILKQVAGVTIVIFNITGFDVKEGKKTATGKNKKLIDMISKNGIVCEATPPSFSEAVRELCRNAQKNGCALSFECAEEIVTRCGGDTLLIQSELQKLTAFAESTGEITMEMVQSLVAPTLSTTSFVLASAVVQKKPTAAMQALETLFAMRIPRPILLSAMSSSFLDLYRAATAIRSRKLESDMKSDFGYRYDFVVNNAFRDCRKSSLERIRSCLRILEQLEKTCNSTAVEEQIAIEAAVVKMLTITN